MVMKKISCKQMKLPIGECCNYLLQEECKLVRSEWQQNMKNVRRKNGLQTKNIWRILNQTSELLKSG